ncbi:MAG: SPFH domain-containing protein, partial [Alphaproteobacteria bacterium]|nr:SPFH domain-containing protein [Alphaproteobacteria bacterium]
MIWDKIVGEFVDVIEWTDDSADTMLWRFERHGNEIKYGAQLTVRESQIAVFVNEGRVADVFEPGMYTLETANLPIISTMENWHHGFQSPFKAEIYFVNTKRFTDLKWGTKHPVTLRDPEFGPVRLRAFGTYVTKIKDPVVFIREIAGTDGHFTTDEITDQLRNMIVSRFASVMADSGIPVLDLAANYEKLGTFLTNKIMSEFDLYGLELSQMMVESISLPDAVEEALDKRTSMGVVGDLTQYTQYQTAEAIAKAAENPGGAAGAGIGIGAGIAMGGQMADQMRGGGGTAGSPPPASQPGGAAPPPLPADKVFHVDVGGKAAGPFGSEQLTAMVADGTLRRDTLVWSQGMDDWRPAGQVAELASHLA